MTINSIGSVVASSLTLSSTQQTARRGGPYEAVASLLGSSAEELASQVASGTSLLEIAEAKGVSAEDLYQALEDGAPAGLQQSADLDEVVKEIANASGPDAVRGPGGPGGPGGPPPGPPPPGGPVGAESDSTLLDALSELLDTDTEDLLDQLSSGISLSDLLTDAGVSLEELSSVLQERVGVNPVGLQVDTNL